jgi:hypothetical protein
MPDITIYMNCDTRLAINLTKFNLTENDEFIFVIKNYSYIESSYVFLHRACVSDIDANGEILFKIPPAASKHIKPGAFYTFAVMKNAFNSNEATEYKKLTDNGAINIEYGAQDFLVKTEGIDSDSEIISVRLVPIGETDTALNTNSFMSEVIGIRLELLEE